MTDIFFGREHRLLVNDRDWFRHLENFRGRLTKIFLFAAGEYKSVFKFVFRSTFSLSCLSHILLKRMTN